MNKVAAFVLCTAVIAGTVFLFNNEKVPPSDPIADIINEELAKEEVEEPVKPVHPNFELPTMDIADMAIYVMRMELTRLGFSRETDLGNVRTFVHMVKETESDGYRYAVSSANAMSFYQFKPESVITAINRFKNWSKRHKLPPIPQWAKKLQAEPERIFDLRDSLQAMLMMVNIVEQEGSDPFLIELVKGEREAAKPLYYQFHHTAPDNPTVARVEKLFAEHFGS